MNDETNVQEMQEKGNVPVSVPYIVHESALARMERQIKRIWIALIAIIVSFLVTNIAWLIYESQFETISYKQDGAGLNNICTGSQGDVYGADTTNQTEEKGEVQKSES